MCSMLQIARSDELQFTDHNQNMDGSRSGERLEEKRSAMYRSLDKTIKSSPSSQRITTVDDLRSSPGRHDRVNNMDQTVTKKKRIRGRGNPMVLMNNLAGKVDNEPASKKHKKRSPRKLNQASAKDEKETDRKKRNPFDDLSLPVSSPVKVSILDKFENGGLSESDSDDSDFGAKLIAVEKFSSSPFKSRDDDLKRIDQLIDSQPIPDLKPTTDTSASNDNNEPEVDFTSIVAEEIFFQQY